MAQGNGNSWRHNKYLPMVKVTCGGVQVWANPAKLGPRCTKCGQIHK